MDLSLIRKKSYRDAEYLAAGVAGINKMAEKISVLIWQYYSGEVAASSSDVYRNYSFDHIGFGKSMDFNVVLADMGLPSPGKLYDGDIETILELQDRYNLFVDSVIKKFREKGHYYLKIRPVFENMVCTFEYPQKFRKYKIGSIEGCKKMILGAAKQPWVDIDSLNDYDAEQFISLSNSTQKLADDFAEISAPVLKELEDGSKKQKEENSHFEVHGQLPVNFRADLKKLARR